MPLSLKHPTTQDLSSKLPREFLGQWQEVIETPDHRFVKEIVIREDGDGHVISAMAELTVVSKQPNAPRAVFCYYPSFTLREERPRRLKAWFEVSTTTEGRVTVDQQGKPVVLSFRGPTIPRSILRLKIDGTRLKVGAVEGEFMSEGLDFHVKQTHDLVGGYHRV
ncbi:MAG: hypothetical protein IT562_05815 [Alphaproteobacteria bacterium]|nr:hypothetical protein [Alphaproteobacteria bacterium]